MPRYLKKCSFCGIQIFCSKECYRKYYNEIYVPSFHSKIYRFFIYYRDNFKCIYCGRSSIEDGVKLEVDHVFPKSKGGENNMNNYITSCVDCNKNKSNIIFNDILLNRIKNQIKKNFDSHQAT